MGLGCLSERKNFPISRSLLSRFRLRIRPSAVDWLKHGRILEINLGLVSNAVSGAGRTCHMPERQSGRAVQFDGAAAHH